MDSLDHLKVLGDLQISNDDLVKGHIHWGFSGIENKLSLLFDFEARNSAHRLQAFSAELSYETNGGWLGGKTRRKATSNANVLDAARIHAGVTINKPDRGPLPCAWTLTVMIDVGSGDQQRRDWSGTFTQP